MEMSAQLINVIVNNALQKSGCSTGLLHYCTFGLVTAKNAQNVRVDDLTIKQQNSIKK